MAEINYNEALDLCDEIMNLCDQIEAEEGQEFKDSVKAKAEDMQTWIYDKQRCTEKQWGALQNMKNGAENWVNAGDRDYYDEGPQFNDDHRNDDIPW